MVGFLSLSSCCPYLPTCTSPKLEMSPAEADLKEPEPSSPFNRMIPMNPSYRTRIRDETMDVALFSNAFRDAVAIEYADEYAVNFVKACMWPHNPVEVSRLELGELGVRVGHREGILAVLANMRRGAAVQDDLEHSDEALFTALPLDDPDFAPGVSMCMLNEDAHLETHMPDDRGAPATQATTLHRMAPTVERRGLRREPLSSFTLAPRSVPGYFSRIERTVTSSG
jgi:hypothetical protein